MKPHPEALPNVADVIIPMEKVAGYALNPDHAVGSHKARVFASALGFTQSNARDLVDQILGKLPSIAAVERTQTEYGSVFSVDVPVTGPRGSGVVTTGWALDFGQKAPKLTSLRVAKGRKNATRT